MFPSILVSTDSCLHASTQFQPAVHPASASTESPCHAALPVPPHRVSVVVPCCDEAQSLPRLAAALQALLDQAPGTIAELVFVDDGSSDDTWNLLQAEYGSRRDVTLVQHAQNRGIAAAIATGIQEATSEIVGSIDADCTYDPRYLLAMFPLLTDGVDLVVASPYHPLGVVENVPAWRLAISRLASRLYRIVMRNKLHTYTSCFRVYRRSAVLDLPLSNGGFAGVAELVWQLDRCGSTIVECPARLEVRRLGQSKMRLLRVTLGHLRLLARAAWDRMFGRAPLRDGPRRDSASLSPLVSTPVNSDLPHEILT